MDLNSQPLVRKASAVPGGIQLWVTCHVPPKRPYFFSLRTTFTQWSPIFIKLLVTERPWHIFVPQRPLIFAFMCQTSDNFRQNIGFFDKFDEMLRNFGNFGPESPFFWCISLKDPLFLCALSLKDPLFWRNLSPKTPTSEVLGGTLRHFHKWVPSPPPGAVGLSIELTLLPLIWWSLYRWLQPLPVAQHNHDNLWWQICDLHWKSWCRPWNWEI